MAEVRKKSRIIQKLPPFHISTVDVTTAIFNVLPTAFVALSVCFIANINFNSRRKCKKNKKAQLSLTNPRNAKACQNCSYSTCLQRCR